MSTPETPQDAPEPRPSFGYGGRIDVAAIERVECPSCSAAPGESCDWPAWVPHPARFEAAEQTDQDGSTS